MIDAHKLGQTMAAHWTSFIDPTSLAKETVRLVAAAKLPLSPGKQMLEVKVSFMDVGPEGVTWWVEFNVPSGGQAYVGTLEFHRGWDGRVVTRPFSGVRPG
jgi:hypothetical protein